LRSLSSTGSFYANPLYDDDDPDPSHAAFPEYSLGNVWPVALPELAPSFKKLGGIMVNVGAMLAQHCDAYVRAKHPDVNVCVADLIASSRTIKGRLLHYWPKQGQDNASNGDDNEAEDSWCGLHLDNSLVSYT
jgi:hypothetical protein